MFTKIWYDMFSIIGASVSINVKAYDGSAQSVKASANCAAGGRFMSFNSADSQYMPYMKRHVEARSSYGGVIFGNGTSQPTVDDYTMSDITGLSVSATTTTKTNEDGSRTITGVYTITNPTNSDVTVSEVGLTGNINATLSGRYLYERTLLNNPVEIPAGGVGQVTYEITLPYPT